MHTDSYAWFYDALSFSFYTFLTWSEGKGLVEATASRKQQALLVSSWVCLLQMTSKVLLVHCPSGCH